MRTRIAQAPIGSHLLREDSWIERTEALHRVMTPAAGDSVNEVVRATIPPDAVDATVDRVIADFAAIGSTFKWVVAFDSSPEAAIAAALEARGFERWDAVGMWAPSSLSIVAPDVEVERVEGAGLAEYAEVSAEGWGADPEVFRRRFASAPDHFRFFVARVDGRAIGAAATVNHPRDAYLTGAVVLPEARGRGAYKALLAARLQLAAAEGREAVVTQARAQTSAPILERLGFTPAYRFRMFRSR